MTCFVDLENLFTFSIVNKYAIVLFQYVNLNKLIENLH